MTEQIERVAWDICEMETGETCENICSTCHAHATIAVKSIAAQAAIAAANQWQPMSDKARTGMVVELYRPPLIGGGIRRSFIHAMWIDACDGEEIGAFIWPGFTNNELDLEAYDQALNSGNFFHSDKFTHYRVPTVPTPPAEKEEA